MNVALALGRRTLGQAWPNPAVGAVVAQAGPQGPVIVGRGWTQPGGRPHAETEALQRAGEAARGGTLYVTLEPCSHHGRTPPCVDAIIAAGIGRVVSAMDDPNPLVAGAGHARLREGGIVVDVGLGAGQARRDHVGHIMRTRAGRPSVTLKLAVSADGKAGLAGRQPAAITAGPARVRVHAMRAAHDAVVTGIGTALSDDPLLTCRLPGMQARSPVRVVLDSALRLPLASRLVASIGQAPLWVVTAPQAAADREAALRERGVVVLRTADKAGRVDLHAALRALAERGVTRVMAETGPILAAALLQADLVDAAALFRASMTIGADGIEAIEGSSLARLTDNPHLTLSGVEEVGGDRLERFERAI